VRALRGSTVSTALKRTSEHAAAAPRPGVRGNDPLDWRNAGAEKGWQRAEADTPLGIRPHCGLYRAPFSVSHWWLGG